MSGKKHHVLNPWGLTLGQVDAMDALCESGLVKTAAARLKMQGPAISEQLKRARKKMAAPNHVRAALLWDRWRQGEGKGVPA